MYLYEKSPRTAYGEILSVGIFRMVFTIIFAFVKALISFGYDSVNLIYLNADAYSECHCYSEFAVVDLKYMSTQ